MVGVGIFVTDREEVFRRRVLGTGDFSSTNFTPSV